MSAALTTLRDLYKDVEASNAPDKESQLSKIVESIEAIAKEQVAASTATIDVPENTEVEASPKNDEAGDGTESSPQVESPNDDSAPTDSDATEGDADPDATDTGPDTEADDATDSPNNPEASDSPETTEASTPDNASAETEASQENNETGDDTVNAKNQAVTASTAHALTKNNDAEVSVTDKLILPGARFAARSIDKQGVNNDTANLGRHIKRVLADVPKRGDRTSEVAEFAYRPDYKTYSEADGGDFDREAYRDGQRDHMDQVKKRIAYRASRGVEGLAAEFSANEKNIDVTTLAARAGFCLPPMPVAQFCEVKPLSGLVGLPSFSMPVQGIQLPSEPDINPLWDNLHCFTEAEEMARVDPKPCVEIECVDWTSIIPCIVPMCVEGDIITQAALPELAAHYLALALRTYQQFMNALTIASIEAGSDDVDFTDLPSSGLANDIISVIMRLTSQMRIRSQRPEGDPIRAIAPEWLLDALTEDTHRRMGFHIGNAAMARAYVEVVLAQASIDVTWVRDWQEARVDADPTGWGGNEWLTSWPETVRIGLFFADTWESFDTELVRVQGERSSASLIRDNKEMVLFLEHARATVNRCGASVVAELPVCPSGVTLTRETDADQCFAVSDADDGNGDG